MTELLRLLVSVAILAMWGMLSVLFQKRLHLRANITRRGFKAWRAACRVSWYIILMFIIHNKLTLPVERIVRDMRHVVAAGDERGADRRRAEGGEHDTVDRPHTDRH